MSDTNTSQTRWHAAGLADDRNKANIPYIRNRIALAVNKSTVSDLLDELEETRLSLTDALRRLAEVEAVNQRMELALTRLRDCDWVISLPDRMDAVRAIAREALLPPAPSNQEAGAQ